MPLVHVAGLNKFYTGGTARLHVLRDLEVDVAEGEMVAVVGASGVGKSTLLHLLGGLDRARQRRGGGGGPAARRSQRFGLVAFRNRQVGFVFQFHHLLARVHRARERRDADADRAALPLGEARARATELLARVGLAERVEHRPSMMSGGEQQRVAVARALVMRPALLLARRAHRRPRRTDGGGAARTAAADARRARPDVGHCHAQSEAGARLRPGSAAGGWAADAEGH
jgi:lipoprotein-releasing system ATP-binding protein